MHPTATPRHNPTSWPQQRLGERVLGCFTLERLLAVGTQGAAFIARQDGTPRRAVLKIAHPSTLHTPHPEAATRFLAEFRAASSVHHPNIATVYLAGTTEDGLPAIAMEYVEGPTLAELLQQRAPLHPQETLALAAQLAATLEVIHDAHILHRDLSPGNIIAAQQPQTHLPLYKLLDFGASRFADFASNGLVPVGTPRYMAPEQLHLDPTPASDVYALGAILWWAATGQELLGNLRSIGDVLRYFHERARVAPEITPLLHTLPRDVATLVRALLHTDPQARPSARDARQRFQNLLASPAAPTPHQPPARPAQPAPPAPLPIEEVPRWIVQLASARTSADAFMICRNVAVAAHRAGMADLAAVASSVQRNVIAEHTTPQDLRLLLSPLIDSLRVVQAPPAS